MLARTRIKRVLATMSISLALAATALTGSAGVASAQVIPPAEFNLLIQAPTSVPVLQDFIVRVKVIGDNGIVRGRCPSKVPVTLTVSGEQTWEEVARASAGVARFRLSLPELGTWTLTAEVRGGACGGRFRPDTHEVSAVLIPADLTLPPCPLDTSCELTSNGTFSAAALIADDGVFTYDWERSETIEGCGAEPLDDTSGVLQFDLSDETIAKEIILSLAPIKVTMGIGQLRVCWLGGGEATGTLLESCQRDEPPCVLFKRSTKHNGALVGISVPPGDPKAYIR